MSRASTTPPLTQGGDKSRRRHGWLPVILWMVFGAGLLVQAFGPRLEISNNAFVIPPSLIAAANGIRPAEIITHERSKQFGLGNAYPRRSARCGSLPPQRAR